MDDLQHETLERDYFEHDFGGEDLQGLQFRRCRFVRCSFNRADLTDCHFEQCLFVEPGDLLGCDFSYATLINAKFSDCRLNLARFTGARCFGSEFRDCNLQGADFYRAGFANQIGTNHYFCSAVITGCNLAYGNLSQLILEECELTDNRWRDANLTGASLRGSNLSGGEFSPELWGEFDLRGANLTRVDLEGLDPREVALEGVMIDAWQQSQLLAPFGLIVCGE
ncbi:Qnr family pentapeptide repeat protein [Shewanella sp. JBTF-M18]|uniref:Qnr family pentapeptide repeat protein n=1 Tax=Shewanella insulae TaxID=2681496 RepID=A0A6L7HXZ6_9GAMM|nr:Qnr family pentapeptide repeat protein [Shewanella insulae]MXR69207.1 Qnr family pentapeptide repeat protein [Shewanella insulae]